MVTTYWLACLTCNVNYGMRFEIKLSKVYRSVAPESPPHRKEVHVCLNQTKPNRIRSKSGANRIIWCDLVYCLTITLTYAFDTCALIKLN